MARAAYFDCFSGASGDMLLGALLDAGAPLDQVRSGLQSLGMEGWSLAAGVSHRDGLRGTHAHVAVEERTQPTRRLGDVLALIGSGHLPAVVESQASAVFQRLAQVEAHVHGLEIEAVHFHEVGGVDAVVDVVGVVLALHLLGVEPGGVSCSGLPTGSGWVVGAHGRLPVPAPATAELLRLAGAPTRQAPLPGAIGELTTPTGAALLTTLSTSYEEPAFQHVERVGYGFGSKSFPWPNALRVWVGEVASGTMLLKDTVVELQTNLDDATPEQLGFAMERLMEAGALDVAFSPLQMKKNRPGVLLRVLVSLPLAHTLAEVILTHTSALGVRVQSVERLIARRVESTVQTPWGPVRVKEKHLGERVDVSPEYDDCARLARAAGVTLMEVYAAARAAH